MKARGASAETSSEEADKAEAEGAKADRAGAGDMTEEGALFMQAIEDEWAKIELEREAKLECERERAHELEREPCSSVSLSGWFVQQEELQQDEADEVTSKAVCQAEDVDGHHAGTLLL